MNVNDVKYVFYVNHHYWRNSVILRDTFDSKCIISEKYQSQLKCHMLISLFHSPCELVACVGLFFPFFFILHFIIMNINCPCSNCHPVVPKIFSYKGLRDIQGTYIVKYAICSQTQHSTTP